MVKIRGDDKAQEMGRRGVRDVKQTGGLVILSKDFYAEEISAKIQELPLSMKVKDVAQFMGIGMTTAYKLARAPGFPVVKLPGINRVIIPKSGFLDWYFQNSGQPEI